MKIFKTSITLTTLILLCVELFGQTIEQRQFLKGMILDSANSQPISGATISLKSPQGLTHNSGPSKPDGSFVFNNISRNSYTISISLVGYKQYKSEINLTNEKDTLNLGKIYLKKSITSLSEVVVVSKKNLITQEADRIVYNLEADPESKSQNIFDVLRKVPLISITADDQIQLKGNTNFRILFNGKNSSLVVGDPKDVFKVMPANMIEKIEIITIPPAKYDSEGLAGIINVVTSKAKLKGYLGGLNSSYGYMNSSANGQISLKSTKFGLSANIGTSYEYPPTVRFVNGFSQPNNPNYNLGQFGNNLLESKSSFGSLRLSYEIDSLNLLSGTFSGRLSSNQRFTYQNTVINDDNYIGSFDLDKNSDSDGEGYGLDFNYERGFKRNKTQLFSASFNMVNSSSDQFLKNLISQNVNYPIEDILQNNSAKITEQTGQLDYVHPIGKVEASIGVKYIRRNNSSLFDSQFRDPNSLEYITSTINSNSFDFEQDIKSAYTSYLFKLKSWGISAGLRYEHTNNNAYFQSSNLGFENSYHNIIPTVAISKNLNKISSLSFGYTQRVQRPNITQLNPFVDKSDPTFYYSGNPDLEAVKNHVLSVNYNWFKKGFLGIGLTHSFATNTIQRAVTVISENLSESRYYNIGKSATTSVNTNLNYPISSKYSFSVNGLVSFVDISGTIGNRVYENDGIQGNAYFYITRKFKNDFSTSVNVGFYSPVVTLQGSSNAYYYSSISGNKSFLKRKLMLSASISNPFQKYRISKNQILTDRLVQEFKSYNYARSFNLSINYNFGKMQGAPPRRNKKSILNDDTVQKGSEEKGKP